MTCFSGRIEGLDKSRLIHMEGHLYGDILRLEQRVQWASMAMLFTDVSRLARMNLECAFAEGYVIGKCNKTDINGQMLMRSVSRYLNVNADPNPALQVGVV